MTRYEHEPGREEQGGFATLNPTKMDAKEMENIMAVMEQESALREVGCASIILHWDSSLWFRNYGTLQVN
jgi:hypothetical protein